MQKTKKGGRFAGCLLASDIDGTLVSAGRIPERNVEAIRRFTQEGGLFALATGRSIQSARRYAALAGVNCPSIVFNGAIGYDFAADNPLWRESLPDGAKGIIPPIMERFPDIGVEVHSGKNLYVLNHTPDVDAHTAGGKISGKGVDALLKPWHRHIKTIVVGRIKMFPGKNIDTFFQRMVKIVMEDAVRLAG